MSEEKLRNCPFCGGEATANGIKLAWLVAWLGNMYKMRCDNRQTDKRGNC